MTEYEQYLNITPKRLVKSPHKKRKIKKVMEVEKYHFFIDNSPGLTLKKTLHGAFFNKWKKILR